jgi:hypothetical protein
VWDEAIENSYAGEEGEVAPVQQEERYSVADTDFMRGGKPLSISNDEMNENLHKVHSMESVGTVNFENGFDITKDIKNNVSILSEHAENHGWE